MLREDRKAEEIEREREKLLAQISSSKGRDTAEASKRLEDLNLRSRSDRDRELEIGLREWMKDKRSHESNLSRLFGVISGNQSATSLEAVQKLQIWPLVEREQDGWLLFIVIIQSHSVMSIHHVQLSKTAAEREYEKYKMESNMEIIQFKKGYEHVLHGLESAGCTVPDEETQARDFLD